MLGALSRLVEVFASLTLLGPGALAPASPGVLEQVEATRIRHGYGLECSASQAALRVAVEDCRYLGYRGIAVVDDMAFDVVVVDCQQERHYACCRLSDRGLVADVNRSDLGHQKAILILWRQ